MGVVVAIAVGGSFVFAGLLALLLIHHRRQVHPVALAGVAPGSGAWATSSRRLSGSNLIGEPLVPDLVERADALNAPGAWHFMISYTTRNDAAKLMARELRTHLRGLGFSVWLDIDMGEVGEAAMKEAVENSLVVIALLTVGPGEKDAYLAREYCLKELRWAFAAGVRVQTVMDMRDKPRFQALVEPAPDEIKEKLKDIECVDLNHNDTDFFDVGVRKILKKAKLLRTEDAPDA